MMREKSGEEEIYFAVGDVVWRRVGHFYQRATVTAVDGEMVTLGSKQASVDELLAGSVFAVPDYINGIAFEVSVYHYLVFRTYKSGRLMHMGKRGEPEGLYIEKSICDNYRRQHFPGHPTGKADVLRLLAELEKQS